MAVHSIRRRTAENWATLNPVLLNGKVGLEKDTGLFKWGDGKTKWNDLPYANKQTVIAAINDGKLSIYQGGVLMGTFTANQAGDASINLAAGGSGSGIAQVQSDWEQTDALSVDYIKNKPVIPAAQVSADWNATTGAAQILNKPTIPAAAANGVTTFTQGGVTKGTCSANQSTNATITFDPGVSFPIVGGRLSVQSGVCVPTADIPNATSLFYVPGDSTSGGHNSLSVPNATQNGWSLLQLTSQLPLSLSSVAVGVYDIFAYQLSGANYIDLGPAWTSITTRSLLLGTLQGTPVNSAAMTTTVNKHSIPANGAILLGTVYMSAAGATQDTINNRFVANVYNSSQRFVEASATGVHNYNSSTVREWNGGSGIARAQFVLPSPQSIHAFGRLDGNTGAVINLAVDSPTDQSGSAAANSSGYTIFTTLLAPLVNVQPGLHFWTFSEYVWPAGTATFGSAVASALLCI